jgi:hypothetical protein
MTMMTSLHYLLEKEMCAGLSRWTKIRVHRGDEIVDYDVNVRGQLEIRPPRQARRTDPFGIRPPQTNTNSRRVARLVVPSEDGCGDRRFLQSLSERGDDTGDCTCTTFTTNNEEGDPSLLYPEQYLGFVDDNSFAFDFGFDSDLFGPSDSFYGY